ncbi:MAG: hypothetical protein IJ877_06105 [Candidatus Gastranaerophilales bacterium]|nr:hypothetical protein [Candidatus Gastranaerophilales bacterium]
MKLSSKEIIKILITKECITQKELSNILNEKSSKRYSPASFSHKINRGTITFNDMVEIIDILGYELELKEKT